MQYDSKDEIFDVSALDNGRITLDLLDEESNLLARMKYQNFDTWTEWIAEDSPVINIFSSF